MILVLSLLSLFNILLFREETEIIEGEVVEIQIDRPTTSSVSVTTSPPPSFSNSLPVSPHLTVGCKGRQVDIKDYGDGDSI